MAATNAQNSLNQFALKLFNKLSAGKDANFFISPFSISTAMSMCLAGARHDTASQLKELLNVSHLDDNQILELNQSYLANVNNSLGKDIKINTANKIYPHKGFQIHQEFIDLLAKKFHSEIQQLNYSNGQESAQTINSWVAEQTKDKIKNLVSPNALNDLTRLVLVNAIYFKGNWLTQFKPDQTGKEDFHLSDGSVKKVDMMRLYNKKFKYMASPGGINADTLELPYEGETVAMTIILPHKTHNLAAVEKQLTVEVIQEVLTSRWGTSGAPKDPIHLQLPKFKLEHKEEVRINELLFFHSNINSINLN
jgi:serpin B